MDRQLETSRQEKVIRLLYYLILVGFLLFYLLPFWGAFTTSLKTAGEVLTTNPLSMPRRPTFQGYVDAFNHLKKPLLNSLIATSGGAFFSVLFGSICGYVFALYRLNSTTSSLCCWYVQPSRHTKLFSFLFFRRSKVWFVRFCIGTYSCPYSLWNPYDYFNVPQFLWRHSSMYRSAGDARWARSMENLPQSYSAQYQNCYCDCDCVSVYIDLE